MPKPRTEAREQRRAARDLARRHAIAAVEGLLAGQRTILQRTILRTMLTFAIHEAYDAEVRRIVERMRLQYRLRVEHAPRPDLARGDSGGSDEPG